MGTCPDRTQACAAGRGRPGGRLSRAGAGLMMGEVLVLLGMDRRRLCLRICTAPLARNPRVAALVVSGKEGQPEASVSSTLDERGQ